MSAWSTALLSLATLVAVPSLQLYYWPTAVPALPPSFFVHARRIAWGVRLVVLGLSGVAVVWSPTPACLAWAACTGVLSLLAGFFHPKKALPAVMEPPHVRADEETSLAADATVVTVECAGAHAAWPLEVVVPHHLIHDVVNGQPVLVSWCQACRTANVFDRVVDGRALTFEVTSVWRRNMVVADVETGSVWQQASGECVAGPLQGRSLGVLGGALERFGPWRQAHPTAPVAREPARWTGLLPRALIVRMLQRATRRALVPGRTLTDTRLSGEVMVVGLVHRGVAWAWPLEVVIAAGQVTQPVDDGVLAVRYLPERDLVEAVVERDAARTPVRVERLFWAGWYEFHPDTRLAV